MTEPTYVVHSEPAGWPAPLRKAYVSVAHKLPGHVEELLLSDLGEGLARIVCVPFWTDGLAHLDVVALDPAGGPIRVHERSGHRVLRALFKPTAPTGLTEALVAVGEFHGTPHEHWGDQFTVFDIAPGADPQDLVGSLDKLETEGHLIWEWGD